MKVIATDVSRRYNLRLKELHRVAQPGEIFEVTEERFVYLNGNNPRGYRVVEWYQEPEEVVEEPVMAEEAPVAEVVEPIVEEVPVEEVVEPEVVEAPVEEEKPKKKRTTKKKTEEVVEEVTEEAPKKKTSKKKAE